MKNTHEKAVKNFEGSCNCCQAVICAYAKEVGITESDAYKIASGFGGGLRAEEVCGAVSGAIMALGLKEGPENMDDDDRQNKIKEKTIEFNEKFKNLHGSLRCSELKPKDICSKLVEDACRIMDDMI